MDTFIAINRRIKKKTTKKVENSICIKKNYNNFRGNFATHFLTQIHHQNLLYITTVTHNEQKKKKDF